MNVEIKESREAGVIRLNYGADGIMYAYISEEVDDQVGAQKRASEAIGEMTNKTRIPLLVEYADFVLPNNESRVYWAKEESSPYTCAEAYVLKSTALKLIGNWYLKFNKPPRPTKIFNNRQDAVEWLKDYL